jgi:hypothetical protein
MVTSTPLENLSLLLYEPQDKNFNFGTTKTLILHARSIFFRGGHITKIWSKKIFFMKTLSKLGALTVYLYSVFTFVATVLKIFTVKSYEKKTLKKVQNPKGKFCIIFCL